jgi:phage-related protein
MHGTGEGSHIKEVTMPRTEVVFFADDDGTSPLLLWLDQQERKVQDKCLVKIERLEELGHELRRPEADYLRDDIYELRVRHRSVNYRMLYFFTEGIAVISHGLTKEDAVPDRDISLAVSNKAKFEHDPEAHTYKE